MTKREKYEADFIQFADSFRLSPAYLALKEADRALTEDFRAQDMYKKKAQMEGDLYLIFKLHPENKDAALKEYKALVQEMEKIPAAVAYEKAYGEVCRIKKIFEDEILRRLI